MHICHGQHLFSDTALFPGLCRSTYAPTPWVIAGSAITAQDDSLWSGFNTTPISHFCVLCSTLGVRRSPPLHRFALAFVGANCYIFSIRRYAETSDQAAMCETFDMGQARCRADSFDKCYREIVRLLATNIQVAVDDTRC